jgi:hypothetical protein
MGEEDRIIAGPKHFVGYGAPRWVMDTEGSLQIFTIPG